MAFEKTQAKIGNKWVWLNVKYLVLIFIINAGYSLILLFLSLAFPSSKADISGKGIDWFQYFFHLPVVIIPLLIINANFLLLADKSLSKSPLKAITIKFLVLFLGIILGTYICELINSAFSEYLPANESFHLGINGHKFSPLLEALTVNLFWGMLIGIPILAVQFIRQNINVKLMGKEIELNSLQQLKTKAQLETLQAKINPHFLYNALNSIASLAQEDPSKVEQMAIALSKFFRYSTGTTIGNYSSIQKEIEMVSTYLEIEKIRFDERLTYSLISNADGDYLIPRFLIQPLVENAIKHGLSKITTQTVLNVLIEKVSSQIEISIYDNGPDFPKELLMGYGLLSTYEKLNFLFPDQYEIQFINGKEKRIIITLKKLIKNEPTL